MGADVTVNLSMSVSVYKRYTPTVICILQVNNSHSGLFTVYTGRANRSLLNHIDKVDNEDNLPFWWSDEANQLKHSSG